MAMILPVSVRKRMKFPGHGSGAAIRSLTRILKSHGCPHEFLGRRQFCAPASRAMLQRLFLAEVEVTEARLRRAG